MCWRSTTFTKSHLYTCLPACPRWRISDTRCCNAFILWFLWHKSIDAQTPTTAALLGRNVFLDVILRLRTHAHMVRKEWSVGALFSNSLQSASHVNDSNFSMDEDRQLWSVHKKCTEHYKPAEARKREFDFFLHRTWSSFCRSFPKYFNTIVRMPASFKVCLAIEALFFLPMLRPRVLRDYGRHLTFCTLLCAFSTICVEV